MLILGFANCSPIIWCHFFKPVSAKNFNSSWGETGEMVQWRGKKSLDYIYQWMLVKKKCDFFIQLEVRILFYLIRFLTPSLPFSKTRLVDYEDGTLLYQYKMSLDYRNGTLLDQFYRLQNVIWFDFGQVESRLSQTLSKKLKNFHK